jgi:hypothetical protein
VALSPSQNTAVVGAWLEDNAGGIDAGSAYIFIRSGNSWIEQAKLTASDGAADDRFGIQVAIDGDTVLVGARLDDNAGGNDAGSAYVFKRNGTVWTQTAKLTASDAAAGDEFGHGLTLSGDTAIVGAYLDDHAGGVDAGSAYVFTRSGAPGSEIWTQQIKLTAPGAAAGDAFGVSVALDEASGTSLIGAPFDDHPGRGGSSVIDAGSAYVFACPGIAPNCPADIAPPPNGDNAVNVNDLLLVITSWGPCPNCPSTPCAADISPVASGGDCQVNVNDLLAVITSWGACP